MQHINGAYTMYFNTKWKRYGHFLQGRHNAIFVEADAYAKVLSRYIHLNPVQAGLEENSNSYEWSSCQYYTTQREASECLQRGVILGYFDVDQKKAMKNYRIFLEAALEKEHTNPLSERPHPVIPGSQEFVEAVKASFLSDRQPDRDLPDLKVAPNNRHRGGRAGSGSGLGF
jgi:hypothetical protein